MVEGLWEKGGHAMAFDFAIQVREDHFRVAAEFPQDLAARGAGRRERFGIRDDGDGVESGFAFGNRLEDRDPLGAQRQAIGGIFHVAAGENSSGFRAHRGAHAEIGIGRMGVLARGSRRGNQYVMAGIMLAHGRSLFMRGITARNRATKSAFTRSPVSMTSSVVMG